MQTPARTRTNSTTNKGCKSGHQLGQQEAVLSKKVVGAIPTQEASLSVRVQVGIVGASLVPCSVVPLQERKEHLACERVEPIGDRAMSWHS